MTVGYGSTVGISGISAVWYPVSDVERAVRFYRDSLGLKLTFRSEGLAAFSTGQGSPPLFLLRRPDLLGKGAVIDLHVQGLFALLDQITARGGTVEPTIEHGEGVVVRTLRDPDGNAVNVSELTKD